jgi:hypothetical protein
MTVFWDDEPCNLIEIDDIPGVLTASIIRVLSKPQEKNKSRVLSKPQEKNKNRLDRVKTWQDQWMGGEDRAREPMGSCYGVYRLTR